MPIRGQHKNEYNEIQNDVQKKIRKEIREAKNKWYAVKCTEIEKLLARHYDFNLHKTIKELTPGIDKVSVKVLKLQRTTYMYWYSTYWYMYYTIVWYYLVWY